MKKLYHWIHPLLMAVVMLGMVWFVADPKTTMYMPSDKPPQMFFGLLMVIIICYTLHFVHLKAIRYFINKNNSIKASTEYVIMFGSQLFIIALASLFATFFINHDSFSWAELVRNCGLIVPVVFLNYLAIRNILMKEEYNRQTLQIEKIKSNQLETELKYLRAQYHPHFLFNALNTIYFQIDDSNTDAKNTVALLSELLRYQLYNIEEKVRISEEISFIKSYVQFQQLRLTKRLNLSTHFDDTLNEQKLYPLLYQPFLENAFKYVGGEYFIKLEMKFCDKQIIFCLENSLPEQMMQTQKSKASIGIENIKRRLSLLYPDKHHLKIEKREKSFFVELILNTNADED